MEGPEDQVTGIKDHFRKPKLWKVTSFQLDKVTLKIQPTVANFEEYLLHSLEQEKKDHSAIGVKFTVVERRVQIGVHNGWCFVTRPDVQQLLPERLARRSSLTNISNIKTHRRTASTGSNVGSTDSVLMLRNKIKMIDVPNDPQIALVFIIEFGVSCEQGMKERRASTVLGKVHGPVSTVTVFWGFWCPWLQCPSGQTEVCIQMIGGPSRCPNNSLVFCGKQLVDCDGGQGSLSFTFTPGRKRENSLRPVKQHSAASETSQLSVNRQVGVDNKSQAVIADNTVFHHQRSSSVSPIKKVHESKPKEQFFRRKDHISFVKDQNENTVDTSQELEEVHHGTGPHVPLLPVFSHNVSRGQHLSRVAYGRLYSAGFPVIRDRHGRTPNVLNPVEPVSVNLKKEEVDILRCNEIIFQFLAYSNCARKALHTIFFTFQFYRFPPTKTERLLLEQHEPLKSTESTSLPYILFPMQSPGVKREGPPGYEIRYEVDPAYLSRGEDKAFLKYLAYHHLHIDVWDGESLLYIGSSDVDLKFLFRNGQESIQTTLELDILYCEYLDIPSDRTIGQPKLRGHLHLRLANIGSPLSGDSMRRIEQREKYTNNLPVLLSSNKKFTVNKPECHQVSRARLLVETDRELASIISARGRDHQKPYGETLSSERRRKLARMEAVRSQSNNNQELNLLTKENLHVLRERQRDLRTLQVYREHHKHEEILNLLQKTITTEATIHPTLGAVEFFEFELTNPYTTDCNIFIEIDNPYLNIVFKSSEWQHLRHLWHISGVVEENFLTASDQERKYPNLVLKSKETVRIPFKYQLWNIGEESVDSWEAATGHYFRSEDLTNLQSSTYFCSSTAKVHFVTEHQKTLAILSLHIQHLPPLVQQTMRFLPPENSFLKQWIRVPAGLIKEEKLGMIARSSDVDIICSIQHLDGNCDVYVKASCGNSGSKKKFYIFVYSDSYIFQPVQTWEVWVHPQRRVDLSCVIGQSMHTSLIIRGTQSTRLVKCFTSHPEEVQFYPSEPFVLAAGTVHELQLVVRPLHPEHRHLLVSVVDTDCRLSLYTWLIILVCQKPPVTKGFQINLPLTKTSTKRISYKNPYTVPKMFSVHCSRPDLVQPLDKPFNLQPGETRMIGLAFLPQHQPNTEEVLVFINNEKDKNEETFSVEITYL
ncbi:nephrocystin-4-like [Limulus polyphemus]|uniref:Nephrocystin-4-like n=1 Tax=Limulus polyphemus TaxID=6850 RepID=A0ABM1THI3_LIMPO|nr:nephrocystin-4-like [Limulus polyphemus]